VSRKPAVELREPVEPGLVEQDRWIAPLAPVAGGRPRAQEVLHGEIEILAGVELVTQARQHREVRQPALEEELAQHAPVVRVVPDHLDGQHVRVAEQRVLVPVQRHRAVAEGHEELLVEARVRGKRLPGAVVRDELGDVGVGDGDEVAARRVERVEEHPGFAGHRPALAREDLPAAVREVLEEGEILRHVAPGLEVLRQRGWNSRSHSSARP
jgi:hypothetical protein